MDSTLIIGATSELGTAICKHLASLNKRLILTGRNRDKLEALLSSIEGEKHQMCRIDYLEANRGEEKLSLESKLDGIVLITPRPSSNPASTPPSEDWRTLFEMGFIGPLDLLRQAIPSLKQNSKLVILSGITSIQYYPPLPQFAVLRAMWLAEAKALSKELGERGISVNSISLGGIWTERLAKKMKGEIEATGKTLEELRAERTHNIPLRKYADVSEVVYVVEQMLGALTSHISGQNLVLDGGFVSSY